MSAEAAKLSALQKNLLRHVEKLYFAAEQCDLTEMGRSQLEIWGVPWRPRGDTPAARVSISRAVARLEDRGLLLRNNRSSGTPASGRAREGKEEMAPLRSTHVKLTPAGWEAVKRLTKDVE